MDFIQQENSNLDLQNIMLIYLFVKFALVNIIISMKVIGCIGRGSFGTVLKVEVNKELYAVKKIGLEFDCDDQSWEMRQARNEARLLSDCLYHPNIVRYYNSYRRGDNYFIAMQYVGEQALSDLPIPFDNQKQIANLIIQLVLGLKHLKKNEIIHRDIKPANILISDKGLLKLADFGISKKMEKYQATKSCLGTPYYTAPEIICEQQYDYGIDVWSFGVVLYEICHGKLPFLAFSMEQLKKKIVNESPAIKDDLHDDIKLIIRGCLTKNKNYRFTVDQILKIPLIKQQLQAEMLTPCKYF